MKSILGVLCCAVVAILASPTNPLAYKEDGIISGCAVKILADVDATMVSVDVAMSLPASLYLLVLISTAM